MSDIRQKLLDAFAIEHREHLAAIRDMLSNIEDEDANPDGVDLSELHRRLHSLKGAARATDLKPIETLSHQLETLVSEIQKGIVRLDFPNRRLIQNGLDGIEDWFSAFVEGGALPDLDAQIVESETARSKVSGDTRPSQGAQIKTSSLNRNKAPSSPPGLGVTQEGPSPKNPGTSLREGVRIDVESLDRLLKCAGEILMTSGEHQRVGNDLRRMVSQLERFKNDFDGYQVEAMAGREQNFSQSGDLNRAIHQMVGDLRRLISEIGAVGYRQREASWRSLKLGKSLRDEVQKVRMVSAESVFGVLRKMVRDIAADEGKLIEFYLTGGGIHADRMVLQDLKDPLIHILRNSLGHGIESPDERRARGKPDIGKIRVDISTSGSRLELRIEDDGRGLDLEAINRSARKSGLIGENEPNIDSYEGAYPVLFHDGFSTTAVVDELSGRGVGMSVVRRAVSRLQGTVSLMPADAGGLVILISVPLSVASTRVLIFSAGQESFALPTNCIERLHHGEEGSFQFVEGSTYFLPENDDEPIYSTDICSLVDAEPTSLKSDSKVTVAVLSADGIRLAVSINDALSVRDVFVEDLTHVLPENALVAGSVMLEGGDVVPFLNPSGLIAKFRNTDQNQQRFVEAKHQARSVPTILVVDDSITTRTLERSILEANGYKVRLSVDGLDALEQLRSEPADLVVSDIEMPRLDGFGLLHEIKRDHALKGIPVVLVTSRDDEEDKKKGLSLGADAYVVKQRFDQSDLLQTILQLL